MHPSVIKVNIEDLFPFSIFPVHYKIETINKFHLGEGVFKLRSCAATVSKLEIVLVIRTTDAQYTVVLTGPTILGIEIK